MFEQDGQKLAYWKTRITSQSNLKSSIKIKTKRQTKQVQIFPYSPARLVALVVLRRNAYSLGCRLVGS